MKYRTIVADPPWPLRWGGGGFRRGSSSWGAASPGRTDLGYETMSVDEIAALKVQELTDTDAHLFLWAPDTFLIDGTAAGVAQAWGFKPGFGLGYFPRPQHEAMLVCRRGQLDWLRRDIGSVHQWPQPYGPAGRSIAKIGSAKPDAALDLIEQVSPGPYLELFARRQRRQRLGWDTWGNEALCHVELKAVT